MSMAMSRTALRSAAKLPLRRAPARFESTAAQAKEAAKESASKAAESASKASEAAKEGASSAASKASQATKETASKASNTATKATEATKETASNLASKATEAAKDTAAKAPEVAADIRSKASEGLSRVSSAAGPAISGAASRLSSALGKIGGRTGRIIAFVERQIPPTIYYARVGMELSKLVFQGQKMSMPPVSTFQAYFQRLVKSARNPSALFQSAEGASPTSILSRVRDMNREQLVSGAVITAEVLGFFTVGEMIGRRKIIGYRGDTGAHH